MNSQPKDIVDFKFYNIEEYQFLRILARVTTTVVNIHCKQNFTIPENCNHVAFLMEILLIYMYQICF